MTSRVKNTRINFNGKMVSIGGDKLWGLGDTLLTIVTNSDEVHCDSVSGKTRGVI